MTIQTLSAVGVRWDLSDLFASHDDPRIQDTLADCRARAQAFAQRYRGTINIAGGPEPQHMQGAIRELEELQEALGRVGAFAGLTYASDTSRPEYRDLRERVELQTTEIGNLILFFELEWIGLPEDVADRLMGAPVLVGYRHYLRRSRRFRPHILSEPEEQLLNERDNTAMRKPMQFEAKSALPLS